MFRALLISVVVHLLVSLWAIRIPTIAVGGGASEFIPIVVTSTKVARAPEERVERVKPDLSQQTKKEISEPASESTAATRSVPLALERALGAGNPPPRYPDEALRRGWEGSGKVELRISEDGTIVGNSIVQTTGFKILDEEILRATRAWRLPNLSRRETYVVPIEFRIEE